MSVMSCLVMSCLLSVSAQLWSTCHDTALHCIAHWNNLLLRIWVHFFVSMTLTVWFKSDLTPMADSLSLSVPLILIHLIDILSVYCDWVHSWNVLRLRINVGFPCCPALSAALSMSLFLSMPLSLSVNNTPLEIHLPRTMQSKSLYRTLLPANWLTFCCSCEVPFSCLCVDL